MKVKKTVGFVVAAAVVGMLAGGHQFAGDAQDKEGKVIKCSGINACMGHGECGAADGSHACAGKNECKGKGWVKVKDAEECTKKGGTVVKDEKKAEEKKS